MTTYVFAYYAETDSLKLIGKTEDLKAKLITAPKTFEVDAETEEEAWPLAASYAKSLQ